MCPIFPLEFCSREDKAPIHIVHFLRYQATAQNETRISNLAAGSPLGHPKKELFLLKNSDNKRGLSPPNGVLVGADQIQPAKRNGQLNGPRASSSKIDRAEKVFSAGK